MKYIYILLPVLLLTGCVKRYEVEFEGKTPGLKNGVFIVKTTDDSTIYGENIKDGKFYVKKHALKYPGYYLMNITSSDSADTRPAFEIYLESGKYSIETEMGKLYKYPKITSPSKIQEQLSAYNNMSDRLISDEMDDAKKLNDELNTKEKSLSKAAFSALLNKVSEASDKLRNTGFIALKQFVKTYPQTEVSAHLMGKLHYEDDPAAYHDLYKSFSPAAKNSDDGKDIGAKLSRLIKLVPGAKAPVIYGKTAAGKPFDPKTINAKVILVDFWRADNELSRRNHQNLIDFLSGFKKPGKFAIVSVSIDTKADWWITAISDDHMTWPQVSDLKGDDSPNAANWDITKIPTYYLVDGQWNIMERDIDISKIDLEVNDYLKKHP